MMVYSGVLRCILGYSAGTGDILFTQLCRLVKFAVRREVVFSGVASDIYRRQKRRLFPNSSLPRVYGCVQSTSEGRTAVPHQASAPALRMPPPVALAALEGGGGAIPCLRETAATRTMLIEEEWGRVDSGGPRSHSPARAQRCRSLARLAACGHVASGHASQPPDHATRSAAPT